MADRDQPITEEEAATAMRVIDAAQLLAGGSGSDIEQTFLGAVTTLVAAAESGRKEDWIAALRCFGQIVLSVAEREAVFNFIPERQRVVLTTATAQPDWDSLAPAIANK